MALYDYDPNAEWNQNILRNLRYKDASLKDVSDIDLLVRFYAWTVEMCLSEDEDGYIEYLKTGE